MKGNALLFSAVLLALSPALHSGFVAQAPATPPASSRTSALVQARAAYNRGDWAAAETQLRSSLGEASDSSAAAYLLAYTLFHEDKPRESLAMFTRAAALQRPTAQDFRTVALDYVLLNDYNDAEKWILRSVAEDPRDGESWYALGRIQYTDQRFPSALTSFRKALELLPESVKAENNLGLTLEALNRPDEAVVAYRTAITWVKDGAEQNEQPFLNLGVLLTDRGQLPEALVLLQRAETLAPKDARVHGALGKLYARQMEWPAAQTELEQAVAADPNDAALHFQLGQVYRREGKTESATAELEKSATLERQGRH